jgi:hypothetical protein
MSDKIEWKETDGMIYNLVDQSWFWKDGERSKINQYMINFQRQASAGGSDEELQEIKASVLQHLSSTQFTASARKAALEETDMKHIEAMAKEIYAAMSWACANNTGDLAPKWVDGGNSHAQVEARCCAKAAFDALIDAVPDLVWVDDKNGRIVSGRYAVFAYEHKFLMASNGDIINPNGACDIIEATAAANTHHRGEIRKIWEGQTWN